MIVRLKSRQVLSARRYGTRNPALFPLSCPGWRMQSRLISFFISHFSFSIIHFFIFPFDFHFSFFIFHFSFFISHSHFSFLQLTFFICILSFGFFRYLKVIFGFGFLLLRIVGCALPTITFSGTGECEVSCPCPSAPLACVQQLRMPCCPNPDPAQVTCAELLSL